MAHINENMDKIVENKIIHNFNILLDTTWRNNEWHIMPTIDYSFQPLCLGIQVRQPQLEVHEKLAVFRMEKAEEPLNIDGFCKDQYLSQRYILPSYVHDDPESRGEIERQMDMFRDVGPFYYLQMVPPDCWQHLKQKIISPIVHIVSTSHAFTQFCRAVYSNYPHPDRCALAHARTYPHDLFDNFDHGIRPGQNSMRKSLKNFELDQFNAELIYGKVTDFWNMDMQIMVTIALKFVGYTIAALGTYLYAHGQVLPKNAFILVCFLINILLHVPSFYIIITRTGVDTTAYMN